MASKRFFTGTPENAWFNDLYVFIQQYYIPECSNEYWSHFMEDMHRLNEKYQSDCLRRLLLGFLDYLEAQQKNN